MGFMDRFLGIGGGNAMFWSLNVVGEILVTIGNQMGGKSQFEAPRLEF
jgi:hypothetical protein